MQTEIDAKITDSEWEVMRVVWAQDTVTSKEIREILQQKMDWKPATTKTFIGRLVKKGMLHTEKEGNKFIYSANINENEFIKNNLDETFDNICNKDVGSTIVDLISKATLSFQDIENLEKALEMKKKYAVQEIPSLVFLACKVRL
ncbi:CopY/TcrY family copper transport repressor [Staphylococcus saprophyticus]